MKAKSSVLMKLPDDARAVIETQFLSSMPGVVEQIANVEEIAAETESDLFSVQFGPSGAQWCSDELIAGIAEASRQSPGGGCTCICWRPDTSAPSPTAPIRRASSSA